MEEAQRTFIPAAGQSWALPIYDPLMKLLGGDSAKKVLVDQAALQPGHRVLDIGCGTGTMVTLIKRLHPGVEVVGLDPDPKALARARRKAAAAAASIRFDQGFSDELPYPDAAFDRVFSSFMFHHLETGVKEKTLREVGRVLKPGGFLHFLDFGGPASDAGGIIARLLHSSHRLKDNFDGQIIELMRQSGLTDPKEVSHRITIFGPIAYYRASPPASATRVADVLIEGDV